MTKFKTKRKIIKVKRLIVQFIQIVGGTALVAWSTSLFLLPIQLSSGGFSGIATIVYYLLNIPLGTTVLVLNIPLFIMSLIKNGKHFFLNAIVGTAGLSIFLNVLEKLKPITTDRFLACIYGGIIAGIGTAVILKANASTGGTDLLTYIVRKYKPHFQTATLIVVVDTIIVLLNVLFFNKVEVGLYSTIAIYLMGKMIDIVFEGVNFTKMMFIISENYNEIATKVGEELSRGSTAIYAKGMYTKEKRMMLLCVGTRAEIAKIKMITIEIDPRAFIITANARETWGKGFKRD